MRTTFDSATLRAAAGGSVVSIGVFDGVHLGHRAILAANVERARALGAEATVLTFRRHPKRVLLGRAPRTLTTLDHRLELFAEAGVEHAVVLTFDDALAHLEPEDFAQRYLVDGLGVRELVLGFDSKFGHRRRGNAELLRSLGFTVHVVDRVVVGDHAVSSTAIREAVELGDLSAARRMLGRPVSVVGHVIHGDARGRTIGFPTANLDLHHQLHPPVGVYACRARVVGDGDPAGAVANIGFRPTVEETRPEAPLLEVHLFDTAGDLYGERLEVSFLERIRGEKRFSGLEELQQQIEHDCRDARRILAGAGSEG